MRKFLSKPSFVYFMFLLSYVLGHLREQMPAMFGKDAKKAELIQNLGEEFKKGNKFCIFIVAFIFF